MALPLAAAVPAGHRVHTSAPLPLYDPAAQGVHDEEPGEEE